MQVRVKAGLHESRGAKLSFSSLYFVCDAHLLQKRRFRQAYDKFSSQIGNYLE